MSRSFKKNAILKDGGKSHKYYKKKAQKTIRAKVRQVLTSGKQYDEIILPTSKGNELVNQYDICDWSTRYSELSMTFTYYSYSKGKLVTEYPTKADFRKYNNK